jgi:hypothetical protein
MNTRSIIPLIDLGFLTLGAVVALLAQSEFIERLPLNLAQADGAERTPLLADHASIAISQDELFIDGVAVTLDELPNELNGRTPVVRPEADIDAERLIRLLAVLADFNPTVQLEYDASD